MRFRFNLNQHLRLTISPILDIMKTRDTIPVSKLTDGHETTSALRLDSVIIHIGSNIRPREGKHYPGMDIYHIRLMLELFHPNYENVFSIQRASDLEMVSIWRRKSHNTMDRNSALYGTPTR
jgi:hypothetical protein